MPVSAAPAPPRRRGFDQWEVHNAADTIGKAEEIRKNPSLMREVRKYVDKMSRAVKKK